MTPKDLLEPSAMDINMDLDMDFPIDLEEKPKQGKEKVDLEKESKKEIGETLKKIRENEKKFWDNLGLESDAAFYFQVIFKSVEEMEAFCQKHDIKLHYGDYVFIEDIEHLFKDPLDH